MLSVDQLGQKLISILKAKLDGIQLIYLFGSQANQHATESSDIDVAVLVEQKLDPIKRWNVENELANDLQSQVDLVDLLSASTVMQNQIINTGICIFDAKEKAAIFEMQVTSMYQHLNDERADILKQQMR